MVYIRYDEDTKVITFMHKMPFDKVNGMGKSKEELEKTGVFVDECPEPEKKTGFSPVAMYSEETKSIYYDYKPIPVPSDERLDMLEDAINYLIMGGM